MDVCICACKLPDPRVRCTTPGGSDRGLNHTMSLLVGVPLRSLPMGDQSSDPSGTLCSGFDCPYHTVQSTEQYHVSTYILTTATSIFSYDFPPFLSYLPRTHTHTHTTSVSPVGSRGRWTSCVHRLPDHSSVVSLALGSCYTPHPPPHRPGCSHTPPPCCAGQPHKALNTGRQRVGERGVRGNREANVVLFLLQTFGIFMKIYTG